MKKILILLISLTLVFALASCGGTTDNPPAGCTEHTDANADGKCDTCGETVEIPDPECTEHVDANTDGKCDVCGKTLEVPETVIKLIENGEAKFNFVLGKGITSSLAMEVKFLTNSLKGININTNAINYTDAATTDYEVLIGDVTTRGDEYKFDKYSLGLEGYVIKAVGTKILINVGDPAKLSNAFNLFVSDVLGFEEGETEELTNVSFSSKDNIIKIQDNYNVTNLTIAGNSLKGTTIAVDTKASEYNSTAKYLQDTLYKYTGNYLPIVTLDNADASSIIIKKVADDGVYGFKTFVQDGKLTIECGFKNAVLSTVTELIDSVIVNGSGAVDFSDSYTYNKEVRIVRYEDFGAVGNGRTDDYQALVAAHKYANEGGQTVIAKPGATYYIHKLELDGQLTRINIKTNTVWTDANFIVDDRGIEQSDNLNNSAIFKICSNVEEYMITDKATLYSIFPDGKISKDTTSINYKTGNKYMLIISNMHHRNYIRAGGNANEGSIQQELIVIDGEGNLIDNTRFMFDYEDVTSIRVFSIEEDTPISLIGGTVKTIASNLPCRTSDAAYYSRGLTVARSNVTINGLVHEVEGEEELLIDGYKRYAYAGFLRITLSNNVTVKNTVLVARRVGVAGTYDLSISNSNNIYFENLTQSNFYLENGKPSLDYKNYWGLMGTNYCKNLTFIKCTMSRFDAHCGVYNVTIKDCLVSNIEIIGAGEMLVENTKFAPAGNAPIMLRGDYGCTFNGTFIIKDCTFDVSQSSAKTSLISASWSNHYFGYTCYFPNIIIDNITWIGLPESAKNTVLLTSFKQDDTVYLNTLSDGTKNENIYMYPESIRVINNNSGIIFKVKDIPLFNDPNKTTLDGVEFE